MSFACAHCGRCAASVGDIVHKGDCAIIWRPLDRLPKDRVPVPLEPETAKAYHWLITIDPWQGWTRDEAKTLAGLLEEHEKDTVASIVTWLRERAQAYAWGFMRPPPESKLAERLADALERGEWKDPEPCAGCGSSRLACDQVQASAIKCCPDCNHGGRS